MFFKLFKRIIYSITSSGMKDCSYKDLDLFLLYLTIRSRLNYYYSLVFRDEFIEKEILRLAKEIPFTSIDDKKYFYDYALYDAYGLDSMGLTEQYIRGLTDAGIEFLYIFDGKVIGKKVKAFLEEKNIKILDLSKDKSSHKKLDRLKPFSVKHLLVHTSPEGVFPFLIKNILGIKKTFIIDLTDHEYWSGIDSVDHFLEFRKYGAFIKKVGRKSDQSAVSIIPFYPIAYDGDLMSPITSKEALPKKYFFSASNISKIVDKDNTFLNLVKVLLDKLPDYTFVFAFTGDGKFVKNFFGKSYINRLNLLGHVDNIEPYVKNADFLLSTYPYGGGLVGSYAIKNSIPIFSLVNHDIKHSHPTNTFAGISDFQQSSDREELVHTIQNYLNGSLEISQDIENARTQLGSRSKFSSLLVKALKEMPNIDTLDLEYSLDDISQSQQKVSRLAAKKSKAFAKTVIICSYRSKYFLNYRVVILCIIAVCISYT